MKIHKYFGLNLTFLPERVVAGMGTFGSSLGGSTKEWLLFCTRKGSFVESVSFNRKAGLSRSMLIVEVLSFILIVKCLSALIKTSNGP
ncbi:hypothetical protein TNIN_135091 [Trichonephila inaurata madagascariensis]|uniref:Uncharacterized protein n=1 Tax=Trichonephila inaurata madagascariensis TaxID=2747483 RepID=A0A8X7CAR1_9ARAC|nr:hypothetical protein TNIN_135091 [Trichonephila inaurata madagascariensis]